MRRLRIVVGLLIACAGSFGLSTIDATAVGVSWPYLLAAYAVAGLAVAAARPAVVAWPLAVGAVATSVLSPIDLVSLWPLLALAAGLVVATRDRAGLLRGEPVLVVGWTARPQLDAIPPGPVGLVAVAGSVQLDLRACPVRDALSLTTSAYAGSVRVDLPAHWRVLLVDTPPASISIREAGQRDDVGPGSPLLRLRVRGVAGAVVVNRR